MMIEFIKENAVTIVIVALYVVEIATAAIVWWEIITGKSIVDVIFDLVTKQTTGSEGKDGEE